MTDSLKIQALSGTQTYLLFLQFLLFPPLPLLIIHFADLDESLLLQTHRTCINILYYSTFNKRAT